MLPEAFIRNHNQGRFRRLLALLFLALAVPTAVVIWQAYGQLKWEAFYQHRAQAEALTNRVDNALNGYVATAEARRFADFSFLNTTQNVNVLQRSPLADFPIVADIPGVMGYFQVDADGAFTTPFLPPRSTGYSDVGLDIAEYEQRAELAEQLRRILAENQLVQDQATDGNRLSIAPGPINKQSVESTRGRPATGMTEPRPNLPEEELTDATFSSESRFESSRPPADVVTEPSPAYDQQVFDELKRQPVASASHSVSNDQAAASLPRLRERIDDLELDEDLQKKSVEADDEFFDRANEVPQLESITSRAPRQEQVTLAESVATVADPRDDLTLGEKSVITTFESSIDPYEFSLLGSGHLVIFRKVWLDGKRFIQGMLVDEDTFTANIIAAAFNETTLSGMTNLVIGYQDQILTVVRGDGEPDYLSTSRELEGTLLYRRPLSAPFDSLELVFTINQLPRGPGANVLAWSATVIAFVFLAGFYALYRLGSSQIRLARQQQDFVSAVSHELKTPLTSIRMYGEMLKEGWADEAKQKQYFEYIHDESERLTRLISNVLRLAKITRSDPEINLQSVTVAELLSQVESKIASQVERAGFQLTIHRDENADTRTLSVDVDCFIQIVINLVDNAVKFSRDASEKRIDLTTKLTTEGTVRLSVRDFGPGIPKDQLKKIFGLFYRTESELTRETVGTGIGLSIVHQLVTAMSGRVDAINRDPGAQFDVSFPAA